LNYFYYPYFGYGYLSQNPYEDALRQQGVVPGHGFPTSPPPSGGGHHGFTPPPPPHGGGFDHGFPPHHGGGHHDGPPTAPPPSFIPHETVGVYAVDPGGIRHCLYRYTYIWLNNGRSFWFYPTYVGRTSIAGYRWRGNHWQYYGMDLRQIRSFSCQ
jgi:hypothetical protein